MLPDHVWQWFKIEKALQLLKFSRCRGCLCKLLSWQDGKFFAFPLNPSAFKTEQEKDILHHSTDPVKKHFISQKYLKVKTNCILFLSFTNVYEYKNSKLWYVVKWKTAFKRSVGELEIQNIWRRSSHLILDCFDKSNPSKTVQLNKTTFQTFTRSERCKAKLPTTMTTLDLKSQPTRKRQLWIVVYRIKQKKRKVFAFWTRIRIQSTQPRHEKYMQIATKIEAERKWSRRVFQNRWN